MLPQAVNLTTDGTRRAQVWNSGIVDKAKIRLLIEIADEEVRGFNEVAEEYDSDPSWIRRLDPLNQRDKWFFAFDGIDRDQIKQVAINEGTDYRPINGEELDDLIRRIEEERKKLPGLMVNIKKVDSWLLDGPVVQEMKKRRLQEAMALERQRKRDKLRKKQDKKNKKLKKRNRR
jgi:hypothetical protein